MLDLSGLNDNQRTAVEWSNGHLLVLAGPGSGKTRVLTLRVAKLIADTPHERFRVLGLTFTTKAATEMRSRVDSLVADGRDRVLLTTFHSFCADLLRQHGSHIGLSPDFAILTQDADREAVLADAVEQLSDRGLEAGDHVLRMLPVIDQLFERCVDDDAVAGHFTDAETGRLAKALFVEYRHQLIANNRLDFASLLYLAEQLLREKPQIARHVQVVYPHVCVDEFQDTNLAQYRVLTHLCDAVQSVLFVVADDDQIIYQWNGASPERLTQLRDDYGMRVVQLPESFRCPASVISLANSLIAHNLGRSEGRKPLRSVKAGDAAGGVRCLRFGSMAEEFGWIAQDVQSRPASERPGCALLGRTTRLLHEAQSVLTAAGVPAYTALRKSEFESAPMRWMHAALRLANGRHDREQLRRLCKAFHALEGVDIRVEEVTLQAEPLGGDYLRAWREVVLLGGRLAPATESFLNGDDVIGLLDRMAYASFTERAFAWVEGLDAPGDEALDAVADYADEKATWQGLVDEIRAKYAGQDVSLNVLLQEMDLAPKTAPPPPGALPCMTVHAAKGLEFSHVYLCGLAEDMLPSYQSRKRGDGSLEMQEERRNCFVAITRAVETLTLTFAEEYFGWGKAPSRFLIEMGFDVGPDA